MGATVKNQSLGNMRVVADVNICGNCVKIDFYDATYRYYGLSVSHE